MTNDDLRNRGGWFLDTLKGTGVAFGVVVTLISYPVEANIGSTGSRHIQPNQNHLLNSSISSRLKVAQNYDVSIQRTTTEDLAQIRAIFKPAVSELANVFGVSRQAIYNWLSGEVPISLHANKIKDLAAAADVMKDQGITITSHILRRKITDSKSLFELVRDGGSAKESAQLLVHILRTEKEQRRVLDLRLANRVKPEVNPLDIGFPMLNEQA